MRVSVVSAAVLFLALGATAAPSVFESVSVDQRQLNVAVDGSATVTVKLRRAGTLEVIVVDRDGYPVRQLARGGTAVAGANRYTWDGRDAAGRHVPDEAYSFRIEWRGGGEREVYFPADRPAAMQAVTANGYARQTATLSYVLPGPSRVHVQAGTAIKNPKTGVMEGPVMKTVVNRAPRAGGRVAEQWNGLDESGTIFIPDLQNFVVAVAATPLPEGSVIVIGNEQRSFAEAAVERRGTSLFTHGVDSHAHHAGLSVLDDLSPGLRLEPLNARWSDDERAWIVGQDAVTLKLTLTGPSAAAFARHPGKVYRYLDQKLIGESKAGAASLTVQLPPRGKEGTHHVSVNWMSEYGAVAANTIRVRRAGAAGAATASRGAKR